MTTRERIEEVLAKYGVRLPDAPLDALALAMDHRGDARVQDTNRAWHGAARDAIDRGDTHALRAWCDAAEGKL